jgi:hypothetical protein
MQHVQLGAIRQGAAAAGAVDAGLGAEVLTAGSQRGAIVVADEQAGQQFVTEILGVAQFDAVAFAGMIMVMEQGPVQDREELVVAGIRYGPLGMVEQGLDELGQRNTRVAVEAPGGLGSGEGLRGLGQGTEPGRDGLERRQVLLDQLKVTVLESRIDIG